MECTLKDHMCRLFGEVTDWTSSIEPTKPSPWSTHSNEASQTGLSEMMRWHRLFLHWLVSIEYFCQWYKAYYHILGGIKNGVQSSKAEKNPLDNP